MNQKENKMMEPTCAQEALQNSLPPLKPEISPLLEEFFLSNRKKVAEAFDFKNRKINLAVGSFPNRGVLLVNDEWEFGLPFPKEEVMMSDDKSIQMEISHLSFGLDLEQRFSNPHTISKMGNGHYHIMNISVLNYALEDCFFRSANKKYSDEQILERVKIIAEYYLMMVVEHYDGSFLTKVNGVELDIVKISEGFYLDAVGLLEVLIKEPRRTHSLLTLFCYLQYYIPFAKLISHGRHNPSTPGGWLACDNLGGIW